MVTIGSVASREFMPDSIGSTQTNITSPAAAASDTSPAKQGDRSMVAC